MLNRPSSDDSGLPPLPTGTFGTPPGPPPGATRPPPRIGGLGGISEPPEIRRREGRVRVTPEAAVATEKIRAALRKAQRKLIASKQKLQSSVDDLRAKLAARQ